LNLNNSKCTFTSFSHRKEKIPSNYKIGDFNLNKIVHVYNLGVTLSVNLTFAEYINLIYNKSIRNLGFLKIN